MPKQWTTCARADTDEIAWRPVEAESPSQQPILHFGEGLVSYQVL